MLSPRAVVICCRNVGEDECSSLRGRVASHRVDATSVGLFIPLALAPLPWNSGTARGPRDPRTSGRVSLELHRGPRWQRMSIAAPNRRLTPREAEAENAHNRRNADSPRVKQAPILRRREV